MYTLSSWDMKSQHSTRAIITDSAVLKILFGSMRTPRYYLMHVPL